MDSLVAALQSKYEILTCSDNKDALVCLNSLQPDGLVIDLTEAFPILEYTSYKPPAVLALTDYISSEILQKSGSAGVDAIFVIPFSAEAVANRLDKLLGCLSI